jgi:hypothetical protein
MRSRRIANYALAMLAAALVLSYAAPASADGPNQITVTTDQLEDPVVVTADEFPRLVTALHNEVNWLTGRSGNASEPDEDALGPAYVLEVHIDGEARHLFILYPLSVGGPRVLRPEEQPGDRTTRKAWFYGRLSMPDTLSAAGVPVEGGQPRLPGGGTVPGGGTGGGNGAADVPSPAASGLLETWREGMQLAVLVVLAIAAGLAAVALLIRRQV